MKQEDIKEVDIDVGFLKITFKNGIVKTYAIDTSTQDIAMKEVTRIMRSL